MRRNNGFLSFFIFLIFLTYVFYLTYGFLKQRKEVTNNIVSKLKIRKDDFYQSSEKVPAAPEDQTQETEQTENTDAEKSTVEEPKEDKPVENPEESKPKEESPPVEAPKPKEETKTKAYIRVATYNKKTDADAALKKLDGDFRIRNSKTSSGKEVFIIVSKTVSSNEDLEKLKGKVKNYSYQIINQN